MKPRHLVILCFGLFTGCSSTPNEKNTNVTLVAGASSRVDTQSTKQGPSWSGEVVRVEQQIDSRRKRARKSESWLDWERVSLLEVEHARLTGDYTSYVRAQDALNEAFAVAPKGTGPFATRASLNMRLHRLSLVEPDLKAMESAAVVTQRDRSSIIGFRADVAYYSGDLTTAEKLYSQVANEEPSVRSVAALARLSWKTGDVKRAEVLLDQATKLGETSRKADRAWLKLVRGLMKLDQNQLDEALAFYQEGLAIEPGYWLLEEHVAEVLLLKGEVDLALTKYEELVERTNNPEFMDQIAVIWRDRGNTSEFQRWRMRARTLHLDHLALVPEAAAGHALDHFLELEDDREQALKLALQNHEVRPGGEAKEKLITAYVLNRQFDSARNTALAMQASGWKTADALALASLAYDLAGDEERAKETAMVAAKLADDATERVAWLRDAVL